MLLYPLAIVLVLAAMLSPVFHHATIMYRLPLLFTLIPALFDMVNAQPPVIRNWTVNQALIHFAQQSLPLFKMGFSWLPFAILGFVLGMIIWQVQRMRSNA